MATPIAHGGGLIAASLRYPDSPQPWIDLSTGINPVPYPLPSIPAEMMARLPEPEQVAALEAVTARAYGLADPAGIVAAPGTQALIHTLPRLLPPGSVAILSPTYAEHGAAWAQAGHVVSETATMVRADVTVVVRPNNPDGRVIDCAELLAVADQGGLVVVDEAFADFEGGGLARHLARPGLLLLRSFGKAYGLAGLRLGFALGSPGLIGRLRQAMGPWAVSGPAVWAGRLALADTKWREAAAIRLDEDAARLDALLDRAGCRLVGGTRLFRLVDHADAPAIASRLAHAGILVRQFADHPSWLRFGLPHPEAWHRLETALG